MHAKVIQDRFGKTGWIPAAPCQSGTCASANLLEKADVECGSMLLCKGYHGFQIKHFGIHNRGDELHMVRPCTHKPAKTPSAA